MKICVFEQEVRALQQRDGTAVLEENLRLYEETVKYAAEQECGVVVFPENGVMTGISNFDRLNLAEILPESGAPLDVFANLRILGFLGRIAAENHCYVLANFVEKSCKDFIYYNTSVVLGPLGQFLGGHRKYHLYSEVGLSPAPMNEARKAFYIDGIGNVELVTCFDVFFKEGQPSGRDVDLTILMSQWYDEVPEYTSLSMLWAFAVGSGTPLLWSTARCVRQATIGCGLIWEDGTGQYGLSFSKDKEKLHVFNWDKSTTLIRDPSDVISSDTNYSPILTDISRFDRLPLSSDKGFLKLELSTVICDVSYEFKRQHEDLQYFLLAADGLRRFGNGDRLYLQECFVAALRKSTGEIVYSEASDFTSLRLRIVPKDDTNVSSTALFPILVGEHLSLVLPGTHWLHRSPCELGLEDRTVVCAGLCVRDFSKDAKRPQRKKSRTM